MERQHQHSRRSSHSSLPSAEQENSPIVSPLTPRTHNDHYYEQQENDRRMSSSTNLVVYDEATSSFYDDNDSYQEVLDNNGGESISRLDYHPDESYHPREEQSYPDESYHRREEQSHRDDGYYDNDDGHHSGNRGGPERDYRGGIQDGHSGGILVLDDGGDDESTRLDSYPKESYHHRDDEQSYRDDDRYHDESPRTVRGGDHYDNDDGHRSSRNHYGHDRESPRTVRGDYYPSRRENYQEDNYYPQDDPSAASASGSHHRSREDYPDDNDPPPSSRGSSRSREPPSNGIPRTSHGHNGHHSQEPPGDQLPSNSHHKNKQRKQKRQQRDPSVAGSPSRPQITPQSGPNGIKDGRSGGISTMSASAITFDASSNSSSMIWGNSHDHDNGGNGKSRHGGMNNKGGGRNLVTNKEKSSSQLVIHDGVKTTSPQIVIPHQVIFPKKDETMVVGNLPKSEEGSAIVYMGYNDETKDKSHRKDGRRDKNGGADKSSRKDDPSVATTNTKLRAPLRNPDAAKSREMMKGRGKSTRSISGGKSVGGKSINREPKGKTGREFHNDDDNRSRSRSRDVHADSRPGSRSRDLKQGRGRQDDDKGTDRGDSRQRSSSRRQATRNVARDYDDRSYDRRRSRSGNSHYSRYRGDAPSYGGDASVKSSKSHYTRRSIRHDIDNEGYCMHHPDIRLVKLRADWTWRVVRKKCPECIMEDCPSMMGYDDDDDDDDYSRDDRSFRDDDRYHRHNSPRSPRSPGDSTYSSEASYSSSSSSQFDDSYISGGVSSVGDAFHDLNMAFQTPEEMEEEEATHRLKRRLAARSYHFPGNTWCQDWMQYLSNTHTVLGLFFHHPLHPMGFQERLVILFGSIAIGLTISNFTYLFFIKNEMHEDELFNVNSRHTDFTGIPVVSITKLMITLWTLGSFIHTCFDLGLWHMKACTICRYQGSIDERLVRWGRVVGLFIVMIAMGVGGYAVLLRAAIEYKGEGSVSDKVEESILSNEFYQIEFEDKRSFRFLLGYLVEFVLALFVYYPLAVTVMFSGVLGCGRFPLLGGRPREMKRERRYELSKRQPKILKAVNIEGGERNGGVVGDADTMDVYATSYRDDESRSRFDEDHII